MIEDMFVIYLISLLASRCITIFKLTGDHQMNGSSLTRLFVEELINIFSDKN